MSLKERRETCRKATYPLKGVKTKDSLARLPYVAYSSTYQRDSKVPRKRKAPNIMTNIITPAQVRALFTGGTLSLTDVLDKNGKVVNPASIVGKDGTGTVVRGRVHPAFAAFAEAAGHGAMAEKTGLDKVKTVEVPMFSTKTGRPVKPVTKTLAEVREAAGLPANRKGRISAEHLLAAAKAFGSGEPKPAASKSKS